MLTNTTTTTEKEIIHDIQHVYSEKVETMEAFQESSFKTPKVYRSIKVTYKVKGITLSTTAFIDVGQLKLDGMTVKQYMDKHNIDKFTQEVYDNIKQYVDTLPHLPHRLTYDNEVNRSRGVTASTIMAEKGGKETYLGTLHGYNIDFLVDTKEYENSYIYQVADDHITYRGCHNKPPKPEYLAQTDVGKRLAETYLDIEAGRGVATYSDAMKYLQYLSDNGETLFKDAKKAMNEVALSHQLWNALSADEIIKGLEYGDDETRYYIDTNKIKTFKS